MKKKQEEQIVSLQQEELIRISGGEKTSTLFKKECAEIISGLKNLFN